MYICGDFVTQVSCSDDNFLKRLFDTVLFNKMSKTSLTNRKYLVPFILITTLFFLWGFARSMLDVLNQHFKDTLNISITQSSLVQVCSYLAYFMMALPAGIFISRFGYRRGVVFGLLLFAAGAFLFIPGAQVESFSVYL